MKTYFPLYTYQPNHKHKSTVIHKLSHHEIGVCECGYAKIERLYLDPPPPLFVDCDLDCLALNKPDTFHEIWKAYIHWRFHPLAHGCSHGQ